MAQRTEADRDAITKALPEKLTPAGMATLALLRAVLSKTPVEASEVDASIDALLPLLRNVSDKEGMREGAKAIAQMLLRG
jgi:hypothetical protein